MECGDTVLMDTFHYPVCSKARRDLALVINRLRDRHVQCYDYLSMQ